MCWQCLNCSNQCHLLTVRSDGGVFHLIENSWDHSKARRFCDEPRLLLFNEKSSKSFNSSTSESSDEVYNIVNEINDSDKVNRSHVSEHKLETKL